VRSDSSPDIEASEIVAAGAFGRPRTLPARWRKPLGMHLLAAESATEDWRRREELE